MGDHEFMAQNISIRAINDGRQTLKWSWVNFASINQIVYSFDDYEDRYPWLSSVDPYGHTFLNELQSHYVVKELKHLHDHLQDEDIQRVIQEFEYDTEEEIRKHILESMYFISKTDLYTSIEFIGD